MVHSKIIFCLLQDGCKLASTFLVSELASGHLRDLCPKQQHSDKGYPSASSFTLSAFVDQR